jgi:magnesium transporter
MPDLTSNNLSLESAGRHLLRKVPTAREGATCADVIGLLRREHFEYTDIVVVISEDQRVMGLLSAGELVASDPATPVDRLMHRDVSLAHLNVDQERVASLAIENNLGTVPVLDEHGHFIGLVPPQASLAILRREHVEDLHRLAGILRETEAARQAMEGSPLRRVRHRLPWLLVGLAGSVIATLIMAHFEDVLAARVAVAFFLPGIVYLADAMGTQTETIAVRGLSLSHTRIQTLLWRELYTGLVIGGILGCVAGLAVWAVLQDRSLALAVATALFAAGGIATGIGLMLPWIFQKFGFDPAYGSGPLGTVAQDILSLLVYFLAVRAFLQLSV